MNHTIGELHQMQSLSLNAKVAMTRERIKGWVENYGEDGVYVSFSGGKDSTVLLHIVREMYPDVKAVFCNTGLEYPEIVKFVKTFPNVDIIRPKLSFRQVIEKYGYPMISKEVAECVYGARKYLTSIAEDEGSLQTDRQTDRQTDATPIASTSSSEEGNIPARSQEASRHRRIWQAIQRCQKTGPGGGGSIRRFALTTGILTTHCTIEPRLWKDYRQYAGAENDGNPSKEGDGNDGDYP